MIFIFDRKAYDEAEEVGGPLIHHPAEQIEVQPERWVWGVVYTDDTELHQFDASGKFHQVGEIDQDRVKLAALYKFDDITKRIDLPWRPGMRLIHKYRNVILNAKMPDEVRAKVYMFGYKLGEQHHFTFVLPDDRIIISPADDIALSKFKLN